MLPNKQQVMNQVGKVYRDEITVQESIKTGETDELGQDVEQWVDKVTLKARTQIDQGREFWGAKRLNAELSGLIWIPYASANGITNTMRFLFNERTFDIVSPPIDKNNEHKELEFHVREVI
jgi:SPP1 family predicted phage head-tail adaptor